MTVASEFLKKFPRELPVTLDDAELQTYGKQLADKIHQVELKEDAKKQDTARRNAEIKNLDVEIKRLADARLKGEELRPVMCGERIHGNVIEIVRLDRLEVVGSRPADLQDLQTTMPGFDTSDDEGGIDEGPRGDAIGNDAELGKDQPEWRQPSNVLPFTGSNVESSTGDTVHVGDTEDHGDYDLQASSTLPDDDRDRPLQYTPEEGDEPSDPPEGDAAPTFLEAEESEDDMIDRKLRERESSNALDAKTVAPKKITRNRSASASKAKTGTKKKR